MATLRRKNDKYFVDYRINGRRFRKSVGPSKRIAELALKDIEVKIAKRELGFSPKENSLEKLFEESLKCPKINHSPESKNTENQHAGKAVEKLKFLPPVLKIALIAGLWLCLFAGPFAENLTNKSPEQLSQMAKNDIIRERFKAFVNTQAIDEYELIRQYWKDAFGLDVWYPYFAAKELEDSVKKKLGVKIFKFKGEPQIENNRVSYNFKTNF